MNEKVIIELKCKICGSPVILTKGIDRFEEEAAFSAPKAYMNTSRGRKRR